MKVDLYGTALVLEEFGNVIASGAVARFQGELSGTVSVAAFRSAGLAVFGPLIAAMDRPDRPQVS
ncbi:MAG: hypothetical protein ACOH10_12220 [Rhodoglobus sp.]